MFKPELLPNNAAGEVVDWDGRVGEPTKWLYSTKLDGGRVELFHDGTVKGRSLKDIKSVHINQMAKDIALMLQLNEGVIIEAEFFSEEMNFSEIMHFFRSEDVTSDKTKTKYQKLWDKTEGGTKIYYKGYALDINEVEPDSVATVIEEGVSWPFPGRDLKWATTWHDSLKFYAFSIVSTTHVKTIFKERCDILETLVDNYSYQMKGLSLDLVLIKQVEFEHIDELYQAYDQAIMDGYEGLVLKRKDSVYKFGRHTIKSGNAFKIKDDNKEYDGKILEVEESTVAIEGAPKTVNKLGRSVTSKLKEHREPSGMAKGFKVLLDSGQTMSVSLTGFSHEDRIELLNNPEEYLGKWIRFTAMAPVKVGGKPRGPAHYAKGNIRDDK